MSSLYRGAWLTAVVISAIGLGACSGIPGTGPSRSQIHDEATGQNNSQGIQIVDVTDDVARRLYALRDQGDFATQLGDGAVFQQQLGIGDTVSVSIWEAPPATLFGAPTLDTRGTEGAATAAISSSHMTTLPDQTIDGNGNINVPFAGEVKASGLTPLQLGQRIAERLKNIAHDPQVLVKLAKNETSYVTVVGDVASSNLMQLSARGERVLDALAAAGGVKQPIDKTTIQIARGGKVVSLPMATIIRDPRENVPLRAGDVVTALYQPYSFLSLGATGKNAEVSFEAQGISLAQALARSGGLDDMRADAQGVFIFRLENADAMQWPIQPVRTTADGKVPVIYRLNLRDPNAFFVAQNFMMDNKDLLYVSDAPVTDIQKVLNLVFSVAYPVVTGVQTFK
jgi:polysaccharide biosynthesis/export protein